MGHQEKENTYESIVENAKTETKRERDREWKWRERELLTIISHNSTEYFLYCVSSGMPLFSDIYQEVHQYAILENSLLECHFTSSKGWGNVLNCWLSFIFWYFRRWSLNI